MKITSALLCGMGLVSGVAFAQGPVVAALDNQPVSASQEDASEGGFYMNIGVGGMRIHNAAGYSGTNIRGVQEYVTLRLGYDFEDSPFGVELSGLLAPNMNRQQGGDPRNSAYGFALEGVYHLCDRYAEFDPFLAAGVGVYGSDSMWMNGDDDAVVGQAGAGFNWHFADNLALRGDVRYHVAIDDEYMAFTTADVGLTWYFGDRAGSSASDVAPLAEDSATREFEAGATQVNEASEYSDKLTDVTPVDAVDSMHFELRVQFAKDTALIEAADYPVLDELVSIIKEAIAANPEVYVTVDGHADRQHGSDHAYNQRLSENRARSVAVYLNTAGIPMEKMKTAGHSFDKPLDPVNLEKGTPTNRRTEIVIRGVDAATREKIRANRLQK